MNRNDFKKNTSKNNIKKNLKYNNKEKSKKIITDNTKIKEGEFTKYYELIELIGKGRFGEVHKEKIKNQKK